ncbi:FecR family protein [Acetobacter lovaniensis]|uniref:Transmembrane sensor n=1 Tax=Acetobacter lovaniensis TaxID=104100 RepID=A0A841QI24_9PROT|nr:FecR domain-containing protein [Acetobacter lovaniensis]MBB6458088.1 transmembrane sensor [Acetobacter lovaniensis]NHN82372.1 DUF4880 domain-containing protein [Acetobacter lovaniensis]GBQ74389.1 anti-FecI sigma factor FecR [Acetobacter lovaniensis NRIC 0474]
MATEQDDQADRAIPSPRKATEWLLALNEAPDDVLLQRRFQAWLTEDPAHERDWISVNSMFDQLGIALSPDTVPVEAAKVVPFPANRATKRRRLAVMAVGLAAACVAAGVFSPELLLRLQADQITGVAQQREVTLADGSTIRLAPSSAIATHFTAGRRDVRLLRGEAFFQVTHDAKRPFVVTTGAVQTTDVGTAFDVRRNAADTTVAVREGAVQVETSGSPHGVREVLRAGDEIRVQTHGDRVFDVARRHIEPEEVALWTSARAMVRDRTVGDAVEAIRPWFHGVIVLRGDLAHQPLTGVYNLSDPLEALAAVAHAQGATMYRISPWIVVLSAR